jgi:hypothetical protein
MMTGALVGIVTEGDRLRRAETGTERKRPRWLEFLIGPGHLAAEALASSIRELCKLASPNGGGVS